jgi:hypothetical protein
MLKKQHIKSLHIIFYMKYISVSCEFFQFNINQLVRHYEHQLNSISKISLADCTDIYYVT